MQKTEKRVNNRDVIIIDTCTMKKMIQKRLYHDGDIVEFDFEPNSLDIYWHKVTMIGVVSGILYERGIISYKVQMGDRKRNINGEMIIPEEKINGIIEDTLMTVECDFCNTKIHVDQDIPDDKESKTKGWEKFYCLGKGHHILNMCNNCKENIKDIDNKKLECPHDQCATLSRAEKDRLEKNGIKLVDKL